LEKLLWKQNHPKKQSTGMPAGAPYFKAETRNPGMKENSFDHSWPD